MKKKAIFGSWRQGWLCVRGSKTCRIEDRPRPVTDCCQHCHSFVRLIAPRLLVCRPGILLTFDPHPLQCIVLLCTIQNIVWQTVLHFGELHFKSNVLYQITLNFTATHSVTGMPCSSDEKWWGFPLLCCTLYQSVFFLYLCFSHPVFVYFSSSICVIADQTWRHWHGLQFQWEMMGLPFDAAAIVDKKTLFMSYSNEIFRLKKDMLWNKSIPSTCLSDVCSWWSSIDVVSH